MVIVYILAIIAANMLVYKFGPSVTAINAFFLIGLDLSLRDQIHESIGNDFVKIKMALIVASAGILSYAINPGSGVIAIASCAAFVLSGVADSVVYQINASKKFIFKSNYSNIAGAAVDSVVFPIIAFGSVMPMVTAEQFVAKVAGGALFSIVIAFFRSKG